MKKYEVLQYLLIIIGLLIGLYPLIFWIGHPYYTSIELAEKFKYVPVFLLVILYITWYFDDKHTPKF